jgi:acetyl esterase/lipase
VGNANVTASVQSGGGSIGGTATVATNASGVASFSNLKITGVVGPRTLRFANAGIEVTSSTVNLGAGAPTSVTVLTQPPTFAFSGDLFTRSPVVELKDVSGNLVGGAQVDASIQLGGGTLGGTTGVTTNGSGVATFSSLSLSGSAGPRTLTFASGSGQATSSTVNVSYGEGMQTLTYCGSQLMDVFVPDEAFPRPLPVAVHIHGGAWVSGNRTEGLLWADGMGGDGALKSELLGRGYVVVSLDYRLAPDSQWPAQIHDVKCAIRHLRAKAGDYGADGRIVVWGASAGGHLASLLGVTDASSGLEGNEGFSGTSSQVHAVAPIGSISDITGGPNHPELPFALGAGGPGEQTFGASWPGPNQVLTDASPITWVGSNDAPFYIVHGDQDATVLYPQATRLNTALSAAGGNTQLLTVANGGHNLNDVGMGTPSHTLAQVADMIADFFDLHVD